MKKIISCFILAFIILSSLVSCNVDLGQITTPSLNTPTEDGNEAPDNGEQNGQKPADPAVKGFKYELNADKKGYTLVGFGTIEDTDPIIDTYEGLPVTAIKEKALYGCTAITSITIASSVKQIGASAFYNCTSLKKVCISDLDDWYKIEFKDRQANPLYYAHALYVNGELLTELTVPEGLERIEKYTFCGNEALTAVTVPTDLSYIGADAFFGCNGLRRINVSDLASWCNTEFVTYDSNPLYYGYDLYLDGSLITELSIPDVESISAFAFYNCKKLTGISFSDTLKRIGRNAFSACVGLTELSLSDSITDLDDEAFAYCSALKKVSFGSGTERVGAKAFGGCTLISEVHAPSLLDWLEIRFADQSANPLSASKKLYVDDELVTEVEVNAPIESISAYAFVNCEGLTSLYVSDSVSTIGTNAFASCISLADVSIGNGITAIYVDAFKGCDSLKYVVEGRLRYLGNEENPHAVLISVSNRNQREYEIDPNTRVIYGKAFMDCKYVANMVIPDSVLFMGDYCFENCQSLIKITIGTGVRSIGYAAFNQCKALMGVTIPDSVTSLGSYAFYSCETLTKVTIGNGLKSIEECTFYFCKRLSAIELGTALQKIGSAAFYYCSDLRTVSIPDGVVEICDRAFENCTKITTVSLGSSLATVGERAFYNCTSLTTVEGGAGITKLAARAFGSCSKLASISVGEKLTSIAKDSFYRCSQLSSITFSGTVEQWKAVTKASGWNNDIVSYTVKCSDGSLTKTSDK